MLFPTTRIRHPLLAPFCAQLIGFLCCNELAAQKDLSWHFWTVVRRTGWAAVYFNGALAKHSHGCVSNSLLELAAGRSSCRLMFSLAVYLLTLGLYKPA
jgi:hypothetical protein